MNQIVLLYHFHRRDMEGFHKQLFYYMRGHVTELLIRFERHARWGNLIRLMLLPIYFSSLLLCNCCLDLLRENIDMARYQLKF